MSKLRILTLTTLYPNAANKTHGVFVENRLRKFIERHPVDLKAIAPVPYFPFKAEFFGEYATFAKAPRQETRHGIEIYHPRYLAIPKLGMTANAYTLENCFERAARSLQNSGWDFDLIDAHYYYPDGVAAAEVAEKLGKPLVITARGTDINHIPNFPRQRRMIFEAASVADANITVCEALKEEMVQLGVSREKVITLRNGVDLDTFCVLDRTSIRKKLNLTGPVLLSVGHLIERKGHDLVIRALTDIDEATLLIAGGGQDLKKLQSLAEDSGVADRVRFLGSVPHDLLAEFYNAADILVLASSREGWPNVLLEAMACGTPCIATPVWGSKEVINSPDAGLLCKERTSASIAETVRELLGSLPNRQNTRKYAERFSWDQTSDGLMSLFTETIDRKKSIRKTATTRSDWKVEAAFTLPSKTADLLVTVDTEEIFDWNTTKYDKHEVADPHDISQFQEVCEQHGFAPLYFLSWPLLQDEATTAYFKELKTSSKAELGLHLHGWVTPPAFSDVSPFTSYQCNLPNHVHEAKLTSLIKAFEQAFADKPTAHRAGRYGISPEVQQQLAEANVLYDFSPSAGFDLSRDGGPDFSGVTSMPWQRRAEPGQPPLVCIPVTGGRCFRGTRFMLPQRQTKTGNFVPLPDIFKNLTAPVRLSPENFDLDDMKALTKSVIRDGCHLLTFSLHSTSLSPGATPYGRTASDIDGLLEKTDRYLNWFQREIGQATSLTKIIAATQRHHQTIEA